MKNLVLGGGEEDATILIQHAPYRTGRKGKFDKTAEFSLATGGESITNSALSRNETKGIYCTQRLSRKDSYCTVLILIMSKRFLKGMLSHKGRKWA